MTAPEPVLPEVGGLASADAAQRTRILRRVEDLLAATGLAPGDPRLLPFDDVMLRLLDGAAAEERAACAARLAAAALAPPRILDRLARDADPAVAGPLLSAATALSEATLVACAEAGGQPHLGALARRPVLSEPVTDVLVERGGTMVLLVTAENRGARFSGYGLATLAGRAGESERLTLAVARRADLPPHLRRHVLAGASEAARKLLVEAPGAPDLLWAALGPGRLDLREAVEAVDRLARAGRLDEATLRRHASAGSVAHAVAALAALARLRTAEAEDLLRDPRPEPLMMVAKALGLEWATVKALLALRPSAEPAPSVQPTWELMSLDAARATLARRAVR